MPLLVKQKKFYITFISLTLAIALQNVIVYLVNITDSVMVGRYSEDALSGVALVNQIQYLLQMSVTGIVEGSLIFSARAWGEGRIDGVKKMAAISSKVAIGVSMVLFAICLAMPKGVLSLLSNSEDVITQGMLYLRIMVFTYPIFAFTQAMLSMLRSVETVLIGFASSTFALLTNLGLNYIMIYGKLGCPAMGGEVLEENEFEPFFTELESSLNGKKCALFGSYGWGDGQWMRDWFDRSKAAGANLLNEGLMVHETPDAAGIADCEAFGKALSAF